MTNMLPQDQPEELVELVRHVAEGKVEVAGGDDQGTFVGECVEAQFPVVVAHAGVADTGACSGDQDGISLKFHGGKFTHSAHARGANVVKSAANVAKKR